MLALGLRWRAESGSIGQADLCQKGPTEWGCLRGNLGSRLRPLNAQRPVGRLHQKLALFDLLLIGRDVLCGRVFFFNCLKRQRSGEPGQQIAHLLLFMQNSLEN